MKTPNKAGLTAAITLIIAGIIGVEGGYVDNPLDPGGETNHGITIKVAQDNGYTGSMEELPIEMAQDIYFNDYVSKPGFTKVIELIPPVGEKVTDAGVNVGIARSSKWLQLSINNFSRGCTDFPCVDVDGSVGPNTINGIKNLINKRGLSTSCMLLLKGMDTYQGNHYFSLGHLSTFTVGWFSNRIQNIPLTRCTEL